MRMVRKTDDGNQKPSQLFENRMVDSDPLEGADVFLSPTNAARYLDVSRKFVYELMARKEIDAVSVGGRLKRIRLSALESWLARPQRRR